MAALLAAPGLGHLAGTVWGGVTGRAPDLSALGRAPAPPPVWPAGLGELGSFFDDATAYLEDRYGGRAFLSQAFAVLSLNLSAPTINVAPGKEGWLFFTREDALEGYQGLTPMTADSLAAWRETARELSARAKARGGAFVALSPSNKNRIYPEYMPEWAGAPSNPRALDKLRTDAELAEAGFVDVEPILLAAKPETQLFYKTDTHWTPAAGYLVYSALLDELVARGAVPADIRRARVKVVREEFTDGDLARGYSERFSPSEWVTRPVPLEPRPIERRDLAPDDSEGEGARAAPIIASFRIDVIAPADGAAPAGAQGRDASASGPGAPRTLVLVGDSFSHSLLPFLSESFETIIFLHHRFGRFDPDAVFAFDPDVVVLEVVERVAHKFEPMQGRARNVGEDDVAPTTD